jgi:hypothetical protein
MEKNFQKLEEVFLKNGFISKNLSQFCNNYCDSRDMMLSLTPIFQQIDSYFLADSFEFVPILM